MEFLDQIDWLIFQWINVQTANKLFDLVLPLLRNKYFWIPFYGFLLSFFLFNWKKRGLIISFYFILVFFACDSINSRILKPAFGRMRPCREPERMEIVIHRVDCSGGFSFPSSHAANHAGMAVFLFLFFRTFKKKLAICILFLGICDRVCTDICRSSLSDGCYNRLYNWWTHRNWNVCTVQKYR